MKKNISKNIFALKNRTAVVTGGVGILGKYFCEGLASFGANVVVVDQDERVCSKFGTALVNILAPRIALGLRANRSFKRPRL